MSKDRLPDQQQEIYDFILQFQTDEDTQKEHAEDGQFVKNRPPTYNEIAKGLDIDLRNIHSKINTLIAKGLLKRRTKPLYPAERIASRLYEVVREDKDE